MVNENDIVIVVVLYNSFPKNYNDVLLKYNVHLVIIDNTPNQELLIDDKRIDYIPLRENMGIAFALNLGCKRAFELQAKWVLTLDQDSDIPLNMIQEYMIFLNKRYEKVGLICPLINVYHGENKQPSDTIEEIELAITSGSLINLEAYQEIGGFKNELFIDEVDFDYSLNLKAHGYHLYQLNNVLMQHQVGNTVEYRLFGRHLFYVLHHNYLRHYYMQRNSLYVHDLYKNIFPNLNKSTFQTILSVLKIVFFEKDKIRKLLYRYKGYRDYKNKKMGKFKNS
jgi:rhamnosyltransferase